MSYSSEPPVSQHPVSERPVSALPSPKARVLAFLAIVVAGVCGALIGWSFVQIGCTNDCTTAGGAGAVVGGLVAAGGVAVVAVLTLRAMGEWRTIKAAQAAEALRSPGNGSVGEPE